MGWYTGASDGMAGIFISYRRADSDGWAGRLRDALRVRFGDIVFQDVDNIADGEIFSEVIDRALQACDVALVIIGPTWASARDEQGRRRLDFEDDWVRTETAMVLDRRIRVIPVLVGGARLPRVEELPEELRSLTKRQAREIRSTSWDSDVALLATHLEHIVGHPRRRVWLYAAPAVVAAAAAGVFIGGRFFGPSDTAAPPKAEEAALAADVAPKSVPAAAEAPTKRPAEGAEPKTSERVRAETPPPSEAKSRIPEPPPARVAKDRSAEAPPPIAKAPAVSPAETPPPSEAKSRIPEPPPARVAKDRSAEAPPPVAKAPPATPAETPPRAAKSPPVTHTEAPPPVAKAPAATPAETPPRAAKSPPVTHAEAPPPVAKAPAAAPAEAPARREPDVATAPPASAAPKPRTEPARSAEGATEASPAVRSSGPTTAGTGVTAGTVARVVPINLPNRPPAARELRIGDSWTYRLRELTYSRDLATVTHEIRGGDTSGIREVIRTGERRSDADGAGTQRRLALEPRMFEQQIEQNATLFEFAPFLTAFADVRPGLAWSDIAAGGPDEWRLSGKVTGRERVRTPAGTFDAIKAELQGRRDIAFPTTRDVYHETVPSHLTYAIWYVPEIGRAVKYDRRTFNRASRLLEHEQYELVSYQLK